MKRGTTETLATAQPIFIGVGEATECLLSYGATEIFLFWFFFFLIVDHSCRRAPRFKPQLGDCQSPHQGSLLLTLPQPLTSSAFKISSLPSFVLCSLGCPLHSFFIIFASAPLFHGSMSPFTFALLLNQSWISSLHLFLLAVSLKPSLLCFNSRSPSVFFTFWQTWISLF